MLWWEKEVIREARQLWVIYSPWEWMEALENIEQKWLIGMTLEYWWVLLWGGRPMVTYEVGQLRIVSQVNENKRYKNKKMNM